MVKRILALVALLIIAARPSLIWAEGGLPGTFLNYGPAPRSLAMGRAFTGIADDVQAGYFNPGGLFQLNAHEVLLAHSQLYGARLEYIGYALPTKELGTFGLTLLNYGAEGLDCRTPHGDQFDPFVFSENALMFCYCYNPWNTLGFGASFKLITKNIAQYSDVGLGVDFGALITQPRPFSFGICAQNIIRPTLTLKSIPETYPRIIRAGTAVRLLDERVIIAADLVAVDFIRSERRSFVPHGGIEFKLVPGLLTQRVGIDPNEVTLGLGIYKTWGKMAIGVDYAFLLHHQSGYRLAPTHKMGLLVNFAGFRVWIDALPKVFTPTPENKQNVLWMDVRVLSRSPVKRWQILIKNRFGEVVRTYSSWDTPPLRMSWDGLDDVGRLVTDGRYYYEIVVVDKRDSPLEFSGFLTEIRTQGPKGKVEIRPGE